MKSNILGLNFIIDDQTTEMTEVGDWLARDFIDCDLNFLSGKTIHVVFEKNKSKKIGFMTFWKPGWNIMNSGSTRIYQSADLRAEIIFGENRHEVKVHSNSKNSIYWFVYLFILSAIGEWMEMKGWMRFHALSWEDNGHANAVIAASGGGKSTAALEIYNHRWDGLKIMGDEIFWTNGLKGFAYPTRLSVRDKVQTEKVNEWQAVHLGDKFHKWALNNKIPVRILPLQNIYFTSGQYSGFFESFFGLGLPQMAEHLLRPGLIRRLSSLSTNRIIILARLLKSNKLNWNFLRHSADNSNVQAKYVSEVVERIQSSKKNLISKS